MRISFESSKIYLQKHDESILESNSSFFCCLEMIGKMERCFYEKWFVCSNWSEEIYKEMISDNLICCLFVYSIHMFI